ncbi:MAG: malate synthase G [Actinomycetia bacterium]|nr:malate synthase G [Actinomycetes bacterium]
MNRADRSGLSVEETFVAFVEDELLPGSGVVVDEFWDGLAAIIADLAPIDRELLAVREEMQAAIDDWHRSKGSGLDDPAAYRSFLEEIGYLLPEGPAFEIGTDDVADEIAAMAGPQLVVPVTNARYAINAANARWGSLYDALYGTDAMGSGPPPGPYSDRRGGEVIVWAKALLDELVPFTSMSHSEVEGYVIVDGGLVGRSGDESVPLVDPARFVGFIGDQHKPASILFRHNGLHIEIVVDREHPVGASDKAGVADVILEAALTTIVDCEDSVAAVDAEDKIVTYRNWMGLLDGSLTAEVSKGGSSFARTLDPDRVYTSPDGGELTLPGRSLLLVRNVGHLMTSPAVLDGDGREAPEGVLDAVFTVLGAVRAGRSSPAGEVGPVHIVKPKMHGPAEVAFADRLFSRVEDLYQLDRNTIKVGVMDEERRTTLNLAECIRAVKDRIVFINTGFLDRTGDEIHTSMAAGPMVRKADMKAERWIQAYEQWNVDVGLRCGLVGRAQIGKGMWAAPDLMADMLDQKIGHPEAGANCAWVPSPTAATLHAIHYHRVDVAEVQAGLAAGGPRASLDELLQIPVAADPQWSENEIQDELDNNAQGILGYVVRWVDQGVGCSKVPDIHDVGLMEDRATCRISSQHIANWLRHGIVDVDRVRSTFERMATVVDRQNDDDPDHVPMAPTFDGVAFCGSPDLSVGQF